MKPAILGIDIAKATFEVALLVDGQWASGSFDNNLKGFERLSRWLRKRKVKQARVCMEASGSYGDSLALYLHEAGHLVSVVNPARIKKYGESKLRRNKTDKLDARLIADFCLTQKPPQWTPPPEEKRELQALTRRLDTLIADRTREMNRQQSGLTSATVQASIAAHLAFLNQQIADLEQQIQDHIDQHPSLREKQDLLTSIPGIGDKTAATLLGELPPVDRFDSADQVVAFAGLCPSHHISGTSVRKRSRMTRTGKRSLKAVLFFPALAARRFNPIIQELVLRLEERGKPKMVIIGAVMRKLIRLVYGVLKTGQPFDPNFAVKEQFAN